MRALILLAALLAVPAHADSEADWVEQWCGARDLTYSGEDLRFTTQSGRYVYADCIGTSIVVEVDFAAKYREGLAQATEYALLSDRLPFLLLIVESERDCKYVTDARWLMIRARMPMILATTGVQCPRSGVAS